MGYKSDKLKLPREWDKRYKLTEEDKQKIKEFNDSGGYTLEALGNKFGVSKVAIYYVLHPEEYEKRKVKQRKTSNGSKKESVTRSRKRKHEILKKIQAKERSGK